MNSPSCFKASLSNLSLAILPRCDLWVLEKSCRAGVVKLLETPLGPTHQALLELLLRSYPTGSWEDAKNESPEVSIKTMLRLANLAIQMFLYFISGTVKEPT